MQHGTFLHRLANFEIGASLYGLFSFHKLYWAFLNGFRRQAFAAILLNGLAGLFELTALLLIAPILGVDYGRISSSGLESLSGLFRPGGPLSNEWIQFILLVSAGAFSGGVRWLSLKKLMWLRFEIELRTRSDLLDKLFKMNWENYHSLSVGSINNTFMKAVWMIGEGIQQYLVGLSTILVIVVLLAAAVALSPILAAVACSYGVVAFIISRVMSHRARSWQKKAIPSSDEVAVLANQASENMKYIRVSGFQPWMRETLIKAFEHYKTVIQQGIRFSELQRFGLEVGGIAFVGLLLVIYRTSGLTELGTFVAFLGVFYRCLPRIQTLQTSYFAAQERSHWFIWWAEKEAQIGGGLEQRGSSVKQRPAFNEAPSITFRNVHFHYGQSEPANREILRDLSFHLPAGHFLAVCGRSGAGKSTMMDLLLGLILPKEGCIDIGGTALADLDLNHWCRAIGYLPQEPFLISASICSNVAFAEAAPDRDKVVESLKAAQAWEFVSQLPEGIDTLVGERGGRFSGGQRQRLALARALYGRPRLLLLDEPTSALDDANMRCLKQILAELKGRMTIVMITHESEFLDLADQIIELNGQRKGASVRPQGRSPEAGKSFVPAVSPEADLDSPYDGR